MAQASRFPVHVDEDGRIVPLHPERTRRFRGKDAWASLHLHPGVVERSQPANAYLWGVVYAEIARQTGNDPDSIHYGLKREALRRGILEPTFILLGSRLIEDEPTTRTDSETFSRYVDWIRHEAEHGSLTGTAFHIPESQEAA